MRWTPTWATTIGDHRYDDLSERRAAASIAAANAERDALLDRLVALDPAALDAADRDTLGLLRGQLEAQRAIEDCKFYEWNVDSANASVYGELSYVVEAHTVATSGDAANLVARMRQGAPLIDA